MITRPWLDVPGPVRPGEEIEEGQLRVYLSTVLPQFRDQQLRVQQFPSGYSNLTYLIQAGGESMILRRPPVGVKIETAHDMGREFKILSALHPAYGKVPEPLVFCSDLSVIGSPFYLMERVEGMILRRDINPAAVPSPELTSDIAHSLVDTLAELHGVDWEAAGLSGLGRPEGYTERQIAGWTKRYGLSETDMIPKAQRVANWLANNIPPPQPTSLIHNDFKHDNVVLDSSDCSKVIAVLDWEMATLGDPLMDLGTFLAYWIEPTDSPELIESRLTPTTLPGTPTRIEIAQRYMRATGQPQENIVFYYAYGLFKVAVIVQQLYSRYANGRTSDPRYARLINGVNALFGTAWRAIDRGRIDDLA